MAMQAKLSSYDANGFMVVNMTKAMAVGYLQLRLGIA